jgi:beta-glucanase (GH16 family)
MKRKIKFYLVAILTSSGFMMNLNAQIPPNLDGNWELNTAKSDEFNSTTLDNSKWNALDPWSGIGYNWGGGQYFRPANVSVDGNYLQLKVEDISWSDKYYSGGVQSVNHNYSYGYFEIRAKLPGFYNNGLPCGEGFWPAFWTYYVEHDANGCRTIHDEIDILEPSGSQYADAKSNVAGWHDEHPDCNIDHVKVSGNVWYTHNQPLFDDYHKYAVEWLPNRIIFYFDDQPFYVENNHPKMIMEPQFVVIDQQIDGGLPVPYLNPNTPLPQYMSVDYFRYYSLSSSYCNQNATILNNSQLSSFLFAIRKNIFIGNGSSSISLSSGDNITFRATNEIIINGDFTVPLGSELNLIPTPCN